jgi:polyisoprenyl-phosphate glycosyltransferase
MKLLSVLAPVFNERAVIESFHRRLVDVLKGLGDAYSFEVIYVLDKSSDGSKEALSGIACHDHRVTVLALSRRFGHQMSLVAGIDHARGDVIVMLDSDLQHPPELIPELLRKYEQGYSIVQAVRIEEPNNGLLMRVIGRGFYKSLNLLTPMEFAVNAPDFRLISRRVAEVFRTSIREQDQFLRGLFCWVGFDTAYVPFVCPARAQGTSKYSFLRRARFAISGLVSFSKVPLTICLLVGACISIFSFAYGIFAFIDYFVNDHPARGWTSLITTVAFLGGLHLIFLGILGVYVGRIFDEVKRRPLYIVEDTLGNGADARR